MIEQKRFWFIPLGGTNTGARSMRSTIATFCVIASSSSCRRHSYSLRLHHGSDGRRSGACRRRTGTGAVAPKATLRLHHGSDGWRSGGCRRRTAWTGACSPKTWLGTNEVPEDGEVALIEDELQTWPGKPRPGWLGFGCWADCQNLAHPGTPM